jgi:putative transposase
VPGTKPQYPPQFKTEAVRLVRSSGRSISQIARELGVSSNSLRTWVKQTEINQGEREGLTTGEREELRRLRREVKVLRQERDFLKKPQPSSPGKMGRGELFSTHRGGEGELLCPADVPHAGRLLQRLLWLESSAALQERERIDASLTERIREIHERNRRTYGYPRVHAELQPMGIRCGRKRVARLMRKEGLKGCLRGRKKRTTRRDGSAVTAPDLVRRNFAAVTPNRLWVADITYVKTDQGFLYLAFVLDAYSRRLVGWAMATHLRTELVVDALQTALWRRKPAAGLVHHSDSQNTGGCERAA